MKKLSLFLLVLSPMVLFAQEKYVIKGKIGSINSPAKIYLTYRANSQTNTDSIILKNGNFEFTGNVKEITKAGLVIDYTGKGYQNIDRKIKQDALSVFLISGTTVIVSADSLSKAKISGTRVNEENQHYAAFIKPATDASNALNVEYYSASEEKRNSKEFNDYIDKKSDAIDAQEVELDKKFIAANPDSYMSLQAVKSLGGPYPDPNVLDSGFMKLSKNLQLSKDGIAYKTYITGLRKVAVGAMAPEFAQPDTNGSLVKLSSFKGKYVLVDFWASWCGPCRRENPNVVKAFNAYKGKNFTILGVSLDKPGKRDAWLKAIHTDGLAWNHVSELKFWDNNAAKLYGIRAIPQNLLLDPSGKIIAKNLFGDDLEKKLAELFGKI